MSPALSLRATDPAARRPLDDDPFDPDCDPVAEPDRFDPDALDDDEPEPEPGDFWFATDNDDDQT